MSSIWNIVKNKVSDIKGDVKAKSGNQSKLKAFQDLECKYEGFFTHEQAVLWDCLLSFQASENLTGDMLEIGVYKGRSALLSALHLNPKEEFVLIDGTPFIHEAEKSLNPILSKRGVWINKMSFEVASNDLKRAGGFRWIHIDGEHTGRAVTHDLGTTEPHLADSGILVLDDFFSPMYPQLTEAVYAWLASHRFRLSMFLCGWNKAYLCRPQSAPFYRKFIVQNLADELHQRDIHNFTITKTAAIEETSAFGICPRLRDQDYYGLDSSPQTLPL